MASINIFSDSPVPNDQIAWNEAYDRLHNFLDAFALSDHAQVSRLTLRLLDHARELHRQNSSREPIPLIMEETQELLAEWLEANLGNGNKTPSQIFSSGYIALFLSRIFQTAPEAFLSSPLTEDLRQSLRQTLLVTGPDLSISSMTPRPLDYGPMLALARQTWHRWNSREILIAMLFWAGVYVVFYWWLSDLL